MAGLVILGNARWDTEGRGGNSSQQYAIAAIRQGWPVAYIQKDKVNVRTPLEKIALGPETMVMCDMPWVDFYYDVFMKLKRLGCRTIYRIVDNWAMTRRREEYREEREIEFIKEADAVFASNPLNIERFRSVREGIELLPNGIDLERFWQWQGLPPDDLVNGKPTVVFVTSFWDPEWLDWEGMKAAAEALPEMALNIIGDASKAEIPAELPANIHLLGVKEWLKLPAYFYYSKVGLIAYKAERTRYNNPIKVLEYLASRLPVVSCENPSITHYPYIHTYTSREEMAEKIRQAAEVKVDQENLYVTLRRHSWEARLGTIVRAMSKLYGSKTAVSGVRRHYSLEELLAANDDSLVGSEASG